MVKPTSRGTLATMIRSQTTIASALAIFVSGNGAALAQGEPMRRDPTLASSWTTTVRIEAPQVGKSLPAIVTASLPPAPRTPKLQGSLTGEHILSGIASFYWQEQMTASGERFDKAGMTAAHMTLPFGSLVRVTDQATGRSVLVRINDRGPFRVGRVIDLSLGAAQALGMDTRGLTLVKLELVRAN